MRIRLTVWPYGHTNFGAHMEGLTLDEMLEAHLTQNFDPSLPLDLVPACKQAIHSFAVAAGSVDSLGEDTVFAQLSKTFIDLPTGVRVSVVELVNELYLDGFVDALTDG